ncbi:MAG: restriction endonuclease subunit S [Candidatus Aenigmatarchaeota archaeon]
MRKINNNNNLPKGWRKVKLGEIADVKTGSTDVKDAVEGGIYPLFDRSMEIKRSNKYLFDDTAIIIPGEGRDFIPRFFSGKFDLHQRAYAIFPHEKEVDPSYLYYAILKERDIFSQWAVGSTVKSLRMPIIKSVDLLLPSLQEQKRIAEILSAFDEKIELNNKINKTLEEMAQAIFKEWYGESQRSKETKLQKAEDVFIFEKGIEPGSKYYSEAKKEDYIPFYRVRDLEKDGGTDVYIPKEIAGEKICKENDVLISLDATVGRVKIGCNGAFSSGIRKVYSREGLIKNSFVYFWLKSPYVQNTILEHASGTTILHAGSSIKYLKFLFNKEIIEKIQKIIDPIFSKILQLKAENQTLATLRDLLLPKLMSGEIRV